MHANGRMDNGKAFQRGMMAKEKKDMWHIKWTNETWWIGTTNCTLHGALRL